MKYVLFDYASCKIKIIIVIAQKYVSGFCKIIFKIRNVNHGI